MEGVSELLNRIEDSGMVVPVHVREAMCSLHLEQFTSYDYDCFFHDRPVVFMETKNGGVKTISAPHMIVTLLHQLELAEGQEVLILGSKGGLFFQPSHVIRPNLIEGSGFGVTA